MRVVISLVLLFSFDANALERFSVLSYNVENLFDSQKDIGKNDWTFLPTKYPGKKSECEKIGYWRYKEDCLKIDWTEDALNLKIDQIKKYVLSIKEKPAFIGLSEVENENVVKKLAAALGYNGFQVSNSPDHRGVDVALLYNESKDIKFISKKEHVLKGEYFLKKPSRNILEVQFKVNNKDNVTFFVNHWPSLSNPTSTRIIAANALKQRMLLLDRRGHDLIALGDFNTIPENQPRPFEDVLLNKTGFADVSELYMKDKSVDKKSKKALPLGTYFYAPKMTWNHLDRIFINKRLYSGKRLNLDQASYRVHAPDFSMKSYHYEEGHSKGSIIKGVPNGYDHTANTSRKAGYSDHFGILATFSYR